MGFVDFILNLAALLIWLSWRSMRFDPLHRRTPATLIGTLRPAEPRRLRGWPFLLSLVVLLYVRALLYYYLGGPAHWTPSLDLGLVVLAFRADSHVSMCLFSLLSFARLFAVFYFWLITLALVNRQVPSDDPIQKLVTLHLGRIAAWPWWALLLVPFLAVVAVWTGLHPLLARADVLTPAHNWVNVSARGALVALCVVFTLKYLFPPILLLYLVASYVYLGANPIWDWIAATSRNVLAPLRGLPLQMARLDFAPLAAVILIFLVLHLVPRLLADALAGKGLTLWPP